MKHRHPVLNTRSLLPLSIIAVAGFASMAKTFSIHATLVREVEFFVGGDWVLHAIISFLLGFSTCWATPKYLFRNKIVFFPPFTLLVLVCVCSDEFLQALSASRAFSLVDLTINISGVFIGTLVYNLYLKARGL